MNTCAKLVFLLTIAASGSYGGGASVDNAPGGSSQPIISGTVSNQFSPNRSFDFGLGGTFAPSIGGGTPSTGGGAVSTGAGDSVATGGSDSTDVSEGAASAPVEIANPDGSTVIVSVSVDPVSRLATVTTASGRTFVVQSGFVLRLLANYR